MSVAVDPESCTITVEGKHRSDTTRGGTKEKHQRCEFRLPGAMVGKAGGADKATMKMDLEALTSHMLAQLGLLRLDRLSATFESSPAMTPSHIPL